MTDLPVVYFVIGQTAVGKTAQSIQLATVIDAEIISADSRQIYRQMNIGTAKATATEQATVRHHLIDVVDPDQTFTLAQYRDAALTLINEIHARGKHVLVVGGTGQYLAALLEGWTIPELPPNDTLRIALEAEAARDGGAALHARLQVLDPTAAATIHATNVRRVIRALEVCISTGQPFSALRQTTTLTFRPQVYWIQADAPTLYARIDQRVDTMIQTGLVDEVSQLVAAGYDWTLPAMSGIGYREFGPWFANEQSLDEVRQRIKFNTHAFARRQATWFRRFRTIPLAYTDALVDVMQRHQA
ncbi:MAG: tRNA (adenosine(37)-N6)-dimethylallyltransferase MiaA [Roseiflexaceae bacterium]